MKLIESKVEFIPQEKGLNGIYKMIELADRTAYQSQDKIGTGAQDFVNRMIKSKHYATLEHGTVYLKVPYTDWIEDEHEWTYMFPEGLPWASVDSDGKYCYITTNYRHIKAKVGLDTMLKYLCEPTEDFEKRYTFRFTTDIGVCRELLRHRKFSFLNESTRYCNYSKGKFGEEITLIRPDRSAWEKTDTSNGDAYWAMLRLTDEIESVYMQAIKEGVKPEIARQVLPLVTKTELIMTGFASDWKRLLRLRLFEETGKVHPDMKVLMEKLKVECTKNKIWNDIINSDCKAV